MAIIIIAVAGIIAYFYGSIPFGVIIGKSLKGIDIRETGSGNIGTSNAFRALGPLGGSLVFLADTSKGVLPVIGIAMLLQCIENAPPTIYGQIACGICAIIGHNYSIFLKFKGGKGIATSFGVFVAINWYIALICIAVWGIVVLTTKISSLASIIAAICLPICALIFRQSIEFCVFSTFAAILAVYAHRANIKRLLNGTELKMSTKESRNVTKQN